MAGIGSLFRSVIIQKDDSVPEYIPDLKIKMLVYFLVVLAGICMIRMGIIQKKR